VLLGMCEPAPGGLVGGIATMLVIPVKVLPLTVGPWHVTQLLVMPWCVYLLFANVAPLGTGVAAMLEPEPTWQLSHALTPCSGTCLPGSPTIVMRAVLYAVVLWHCAQFVELLCRFAWMLAIVGIAE